MLHAPATEPKQQSGGMRKTLQMAGMELLSPLGGQEFAHTAPFPWFSSRDVSHITGLQKTYGNQAILRMISPWSAGPGATVQRKCACESAGHQCEACRDKKSGSFQNFSNRKMAGIGPLYFRSQPSLRNSGLSVSGDREMAASGAENQPRTSADGIEFDLACVQGGGESTCDPDTGVYGLVANNNTCCTKDCTAQHEAQHKIDHDAWGCCKALSVAWQKKGADKNKLVDQYNAWKSKVSPILECHGYTASVDCADALAKSKDCSGKGKGTDCCNDIQAYRTQCADLKKTNCDAAPKTAAPCPF